MSGRLATQAANGRKYVNYYDSKDTPLQYAQKKFAEVFGDTLKSYKDNFCPLIVDSISERMVINGFRMGEDEESDKDAQEIWQRSFLDADSNAATIDTLVQGISALVVWVDDEKRPIITPESASEVVVQYKAGSRRKLEAAYREFTDDWGEVHGTLFLPNGVYTAAKGKAGWSNPDFTENPFEEVPVVPLTNRKRLRSEPFSELASIIPISDAINKVSMDALVASEFGAFPQRVISGLEPFEDTEEERMAMMRAYIDRILTFDGDDVKWGQFDPTDLGNYVKLIDMLVQHMASQSRVPFNYFLLNGGQAPSGESIAAAEAGLVAKARERMLHFGESWETAMRLAFKAMDDPRADAYDAEVIWGDPEHRTQAALVDSLVKLKELDVPVRQLQRDYGYSAKQILRFVEMKEEELKQKAEWDEKYGPPEPVPGQPGAPGQPAAGKKPAKDDETERRKEKELRKSA